MRLVCAVSLAVLASSLVGLAACTTYRDQLARGQQAFDKNEDELCLALLRDLGPDASRLPVSEQAQYAYLRGMTSYRLGHREPARHWLARAKAQEDLTPGVLSAAAKAQTAKLVDEMNDVVYTEGITALAAPKAR